MTSSRRPSSTPSSPGATTSSRPGATTPPQPGATTATSPGHRAAPPSWLLDEVAHAGADHLDAAAVARYDRKQGSVPDEHAHEDLAVLQGHGIGADATVLDLGAGSGRFTLTIAPHVTRVIAVDVSPAMVELLDRRVAEAGLDNVEVVEAGLLTYEHTGPALDAVHTRNVLHQVPDLFKGLALHRVAGWLRPGGLLRLRDLVLDCSPGELADIADRWLAGAATDPREGYTADDLAEHLREEFSTYTWLLHPLVEAAGLELLEAGGSRTYHALTARRSTQPSSTGA